MSYVVVMFKGDGINPRQRDNADRMIMVPVEDTSVERNTHCHKNAERMRRVRAEQTDAGRHNNAKRMRTVQVEKTDARRYDNAERMTRALEEETDACRRDNAERMRIM